MGNVVCVSSAWRRFERCWAVDPLVGGHLSMIRRVSWLLGLLVLSAAAPAAAQTHPCDAPAVTSGTKVAGAPMTLSICSDGKDANGNVTPIMGWALYDNGARSTPTLVTGTTSPVSGQTVYTMASTAPLTASVHTYQFATVNAAGEGAKSLPFVLTVNLPLTVPDAPNHLTVQ